MPTADQPATAAGPTPETLRALADELESQRCTGVAARWCPVHGDCSCDGDEADPDERYDDPRCPLHATTSSHAEAELRVIFGE